MIASRMMRLPKRIYCAFHLQPANFSPKNTLPSMIFRSFSSSAFSELSGDESSDESDSDVSDTEQVINGKAEPSHQSTHEDYDENGNWIVPDSYVFENPTLNTTKFRERAINENGEAYGTGRRKTAVARVWIKPGVGQFTVNGKSITEYFQSYDRTAATQPFLVSETAGFFDVKALIAGGGKSGKQNL